MEFIKQQTEELIGLMFIRVIMLLIWNLNPEAPMLFMLRKDIILLKY